VSGVKRIKACMTLRQIKSPTHAECGGLLLAQRAGIARSAATLAIGLVTALPAIQARAQAPQQIVDQAVQTELAASKSDKTKWIFYETDRTSDHNVKQWVAEATGGDLQRVIEENGHTLSPQEQRSRIENFIHDKAAQEKKRKENAHDDQESAEMLKLMPHAFIWTQSSSQGDNINLHFKPNPQFRPPNYEARVFAAMEGDMVVSKSSHRIVSLKGRMTRAVKFLGGMLGGIDPGGTFNVERRQTGGGEWQITETHVHIHGHVLFFKTISEQEDDVKTKFRELPDNTNFQQAENEVMKAN
jgi:hypothetical protein